MKKNKYWLEELFPLLACFNKIEMTFLTSLSVQLVMLMVASELCDPNNL